jgi:hypothetical protein
MHERLELRRQAVMASRRTAMVVHLDRLSAELEALANKLDIHVFRSAAVAYRDARQALTTGNPSEAELMRLFRALNASTTEIGILVAKLGAAADAADRARTPSLGRMTSPNDKPGIEPGDG